MASTAWRRGKHHSIPATDWNFTDAQAAADGLSRTGDIQRFRGLREPPRPCENRWSRRPRSRRSFHPTQQVGRKRLSPSALTASGARSSDLSGTIRSRQRHWRCSLELGSLLVRRRRIRVRLRRVQRVPSGMTGLSRRFGEDWRQVRLSRTKSRWKAARSTMLHPVRRKSADRETCRIGLVANGNSSVADFSNRPPRPHVAHLDGDVDDGPSIIDDVRPAQVGARLEDEQR